MFNNHTVPTPIISFIAFLFIMMAFFGYSSLFFEDIVQFKNHSPALFLSVR